MRRLPVAAFVALAMATVAAFFVTQHLKVTTPLLAGHPAPVPAAFNPVDGHICRVRTHTGLKRISFRSTSVSFYLLNRSDNVNVDILDQTGDPIDQIASGVYMRASPPVRKKFTWDGRTASGAVAPDGIYHIQVTLIHQDRSVPIANNAGVEPVTVETVPPRPRIESVTPSVIEPSAAVATIHYTGNDNLPGRILIYRTDLPGGPRLVKSFASKRGSVSTWDGRIGGRPAPQGTYLVGFEVTDKACNTGRFPAELPPAAGSTPHAGVTVRYLAALPPLTAVTAGSSATVYVDARRHQYRWTLASPGAAGRIAAGTTSDYQLRVAVPASTAPGLYELSLSWGSHRTAVPLVVGDPTHSAARARVLVVLPALTWAGRNPVDDTGDGLPSTLAAGDAIELDRPFAAGLPAGIGDQTALLAYLRRSHLTFDVTTDLALAEGVGPSPASHAAVVLAGDELWLPASLAAALRSYVGGGGRLLSLGTDSLLRGVTLAGGRAYDPTAPRSVDFLGARPGPLTATHGALILAGKDGLGIFSGTSGALRGYVAYQPFPAVSAPASIASEAGVSTAAPAIIGYRLGRGIVIDIGLPGFGASLARNFDAQQLLSRIWRVLAR